MHVPVMPEEVLQYLAPRRGGVYVDCTIGAGGHAGRIAERLGPSGHLVGFDKDPAALTVAGQAMRGVEPRVSLVHASFGRLREELERLEVGEVDGMLADLGVSSMQLERPERGFSFSAAGPLDMRMDPRQELTAEQVVNQFGERELADLIFQYGEERRSRRIARAIVRSRPLRTTAQLAAVVTAASRPMYSRAGGIHPATRTFQALRIFVNSELDDLKSWLEQVPQALAAGGRAVVITFHSLEDRPVKQAWQRDQRAGKLEILTPHVVRPSAAEVASNPRARSAKLRAACRRAGGPS
ncbi:MAG: 16S rRNA (cytosine(1402)-N(4))-methyltransferase RsmH [Terriglobales bacterium]